MKDCKGWGKDFYPLSPLARSLQSENQRTFCKKYSNGLQMLRRKVEGHKRLMRFTFIPLQESHFPLLLKWLETPHVKAWWDQDVQWTPELIKKRFETYVLGYKILKNINKPMHSFIICRDGKEIGYIQFYNAYDFPREQGYVIEGLPKNMASLDLFIGEKDTVGKGLGPLLLIQFLKEHIDPFYEACFVDPDTTNFQAIRAYEKAGFKKIKIVNKGAITWMMRKGQGATSLRDKIYQLELSHLDPDARRSVKKLENLLADEFIEFGSSGKIYHKNDILKWLPLESPRQFVIEDFSTLILAEDIILATYKLKSEAVSSLRSSLWKFNGNEWKIVFHQGTRCEE